MATNNATQGNDTFINTAGSDTFDGLQGTDTVLYSGYSYADGMVTVKDTGNLKTTVNIDGIIDNLKWVEWLQFDNGKYDVANRMFVPNPQVVSVVATDGVGTEKVDGSPDFTFTFTRTGDTTQALTISYTIGGPATDGATAGVDFPAQAGTITFAAGSATAVLTFDATYDAVVENTESFTITVGAGTGYQVDSANATATGTIADGTIYGTDNAESLQGTDDGDAILALGGDDGLIGGPGADYLDGGAGFDRAIYTLAGAAVNIQLAAGTATIGATVDTLRSIEFARGTAFNDVYNAAGFGPASSPNASSEGNDLNGFEGLGGDDTITGNGNTRIEYTNALAGVTVDLSGTGGSGTAMGTAPGDVAGIGTDTITGGVNQVRGSQFDDTIRGTGGNDKLEGLDGNDQLGGGAGDDILDGGNGFDTVLYGLAGSAVTVDLRGAPVNGTGPVADGAASGHDTLISIEGVLGSNFNDTLIGNNGANTLSGNGGNDVLRGNGDDDTIDGGAGGIDIAIFAGTFTGNGGPGSEYTITPGGVPGASTVTDLVAGRDGTDTLTNVELTQFSNAYVLNQRVLDVSTFGGLTAGKSIFGTNNTGMDGTGDNLTIGLNGNGRLIDLANGGPDTVTLTTVGGAYSLNLARVENLAGSAGNDTVSLVNPTSTMAINLGGGSDALTLANGGNTVTVSGTESVHGGGGFDTVTLGSSGAVTVNSIESVFGGAGDDQVTIAADAGVTNVSANLNLDGGNDTVNLNFFGPGTVANLGLIGVEHLTSAGGVQTVNLTNDTGLATVDLGGGFHTLNLAPNDHNLSVAGVFTLNSFGTHNDTINFDAGPGVNHTVNLGFGNDVLNLTGANDHLSMTISGGSGTGPSTPSTFTIHDQTNSGDLDLNLLNKQAGAVYDLGAGIDSLHLNGNGGGVNVVFVQNVENVDSTGFDSDQIHVLGNSGGTTTVTAGGGPDQVWASADADHFRFISTGDSSNDFPLGGQRDVIFDFNAGQDAFVFDHIAGLNPANFSWTEVSFGSTDIVLVDIDGGGTLGGSYPGYEMAIQLENHTGTLTSDNFILLT